MKKKMKVPPNWEDRPDAFDRFEKLARDLIAVPKKELDKEFAKEELRKAQKRKRRAAA